MFPDRLPRALQLAHWLVSQRIRLGDAAVDATSGNGRDSLFLASLTGPGGRVFSFDVQETAIEATRNTTAGLPQVEVIAVGHEKAADFIPSSLSLTAVMFNLGYLPGSNKTIITRPETTLAALEVFSERLRPGGIITVVCYTGHPGGKEETEMLTHWSEGLDQEAFSVARYCFINQRNAPPSLLAIEKKA